MDKQPQPLTMFPLFSQFPIDIRRKIWLATVGPMKLTFVERFPTREDEELPKDIPEDMSLWFMSWSTTEEWCTPEDTSSCCTPEEEETPWCTPEEVLFANFQRYYGYIALSDDETARLQFVVKSSAAYQACKESREFLKFIFAEPVKPGGGLPSWFRFDIDTLAFEEHVLDILAEYTWFTQAQRLYIVIGYEICYYTGFYRDDHMPDKNHRWIEENLLSLKDITFDMFHARFDKNINEVVPEVCEDWFQVFQEWYNRSEVEKPVPYYARVVIIQDGITTEWLTPTNYLVVEKRYYQKHFQRYFPGPNWKDHITDKRMLSIVEATDEELGNLTEFFAKHRPSWG